MKRISLALILMVTLFGVTALIITSNNKGKISETEKLNVVVTNYSAYDFVKQIAGDKVNLEFLLGPGKDAHSYEPSPSDLIKIEKADLFIYVGGEMEGWVEKSLPSVNTEKVKKLCVTDIVDTIEESHIDGAEEHHHHDEDADHEEHEHDEDADHEEHEHEHEFDEHVWTSPANAIIMMEKITDAIVSLDSNNAKVYNQNSENYISKIEEVQSKIKEITNAKVRDRLVFGDKMPMAYFLKEFNLTASAAFSGCSTETEPSAATIAYLVNKVKEEKIPVVLYIEMNDGKVAKTIAEEAKVEAMQIQSLHNVSKSDFDKNETYVSLMTRNLDVLKKALL